MNKFNKIFLIAASVLVVTSIIIGFSLTGSPATQRKVAQDQMRISDLQNIVNQINSDYINQVGPPSMSPRAIQEPVVSDAEYNLPKDLKTLASTSYYSSLRLTDPETNSEYKYIPEDGVHYQLCASFETDSKDIAAMTGGQNSKILYNNSDFWTHPKGEHCFKLEASHGSYDQR